MHNGPRSLSEISPPYHGLRSRRRANRKPDYFLVAYNPTEQASKAA